MSPSRRLKTALRLILLITLLVLLVVLAQEVIHTPVGDSDFIGYWAGARLLLHGQNPYDSDNILKVQRESRPERDYPMYTWNPPWLGVLLLPLGALPFPQATAVWLMINLLLIATASLAIWWLFEGAETTGRMWLALPVAFLFAQTLTTLDTGQITTFMLVGVTGFLVAFRLERWILAGGFLALTTVKFHLVLLWLPLVFLWTLERRRWQVWLGFGMTLAGLLAMLTCFLPTWLADYSAILQAPPTDWATPTVGGLIAAAWGWNPGRYLGLALVPAVILLWWRTRHCRPELVTAGILPISLALAIFGWGYDQILLLVPIIAISVSLVRGELSPRDRWITIALLSIIAIALFWQRIRSSNEIYFFWVPWAVLLIGLWAAWRRARISTASHRRQV